MKHNLEYSVVVPVFESDTSVSELVARLCQVFENHLVATFEIILVDDGSRSPDTWRNICRLAQNDSRVSGIRLMRNYGKPGAVLCGLQHACGCWIITIDDDLQQLPEDIPKLVACKSHDVVVAVYQVKHHDRLTRVTSCIKRKFDQLILGLPCPMSPLKLFSYNIAQAMLSIRTSRPFIPALMSAVTSDFVCVQATHAPSKTAIKRYSPSKRLSQFFNLLIGNSTLLLRGLGVIGIGFSLSGFLYAIVVFIRILVFHHSIAAGWPSLIVINLIFGGLILIALSINGEYLLRILENTSQKPPFCIREVRRGHSHKPDKAAQLNAQADLENNSSNTFVLRHRN